ncbi:hypothetical protein LTR94_027246, partial [Friedmanniomyces endolithicus]
MNRFRRREPNAEKGAAAGCILDRDVAAVGLHETLDDAKPEPRAVTGAAVGAPEAFEDVFAILRRDARAAVADADLRAWTRGDFDWSVPRRVYQR